MLPASAEVNRSWEKLVQTLKPGKTVVVTQMNGQKAEGKLLSLSEQAIEVKDSGQPVSILRADVFRVRIANIRRKHTLLGMAIGVGAGAIILAAAGKGEIGSVGAYAVAGMLVGVGPGAAVGGALPIGAPLYEAPGGLKRKAP
jgi:hypothetical protein